MVITRSDWRRDGALLEWLAVTYPGLPPEGFEAGYRLLADPNIPEGMALATEKLLRLAAGVDSDKPSETK